MKKLLISFYALIDFIFIICLTIMVTIKLHPGLSNALQIEYTFILVSYFFFNKNFIKKNMEKRS